VCIADEGENPWKYRTAVMKARSPCCGCGQKYDGSFSGNLIDGNGFTTRQLKQADLAVYTEENYKLNNL